MASCQRIEFKCSERDSRCFPGPPLFGLTSTSGSHIAIGAVFVRKGRVPSLSEGKMASNSHTVSVLDEIQSSDASEAACPMCHGLPSSAISIGRVSDIPSNVDTGVFQHNALAIRVGALALAESAQADRVTPQHLLERRGQRRMPHGRAELDLVIPALNEDERIGATLTAISREALESNLTIRILVVDNGCIDATAEVVAMAQSSSIPVEIISCRVRGKGAAVRAGIEHSTAPFVGFCDADLSTPASAVVAGVGLLRLGWEVVIGSRRCIGASYSVPQGRLRQLGSFAFQRMASRVCGPISDTQCGFKLFHSGVAKKLFSSTTPTGFAFDVAILAEARRHNHRIIELPIQWSDSPKSSFRPLIDGMHSFRQLREVRRSIAHVPLPNRPMQ